MQFPPTPFDEAAGLAALYLFASDDPTPIPDWIRDVMGGNLRRYIESTIPGHTFPPGRANYEGPLSSPDTLRYVFSSSGRQIHPDVGPFQPWRVELARFEVPPGYVGIVRSFEQYLAVWQLAGITPVDTVGNPFAGDDAGVSGRWVMRLSAFQADTTPWVNVLNPVPEQPGILYPDFHEEPAIWWPAGNDNTTRMTVPPGYTLRVFWECAALTARPAVAAALKGSLQGIYSGRAQQNTRGIW
jgi:hypothetical protein